MILKIIHSTFEIDLLDTEVDFTERNMWFENDFQIKYTLPFTKTLTDDLDQKLGMISHPNSRNANRYLEVKLHKYNRTYDAKLFIERLQNRELTASLEYGFDELPNFSKKLAELPLEDFTIAEASLQAHALNIIGQSYPDVNYNFQKTKVEDDVLNTSEDLWLFFEKYLNNYDGTNFLVNEFDIAENQPINRNIMQPMPYLLHVLSKGFEDAGYTLQGDILNDPEYKHTLINILSKYYTSVLNNSTEWLVTSDMFQTGTITPGNNSTVFSFGFYEESIPISQAGLYKIIGNGYLRRLGNSSYLKLFYVTDSGFENEIFSIELDLLLAQYEETFVEIDVTLQVIDQNLPATLVMRSENMIVHPFDSDIGQDMTILDVSVTQVAVFNTGQLEYQALIQPNEIKLSKCVPDMTFGEFVKALMSHRNYDIEPNGNVVTMNKVESKIQEPATQSFQDTEVKYPEMEFLEQKSYLLKFQNQPEDFGYNPVHVTNVDVFQNEERVNENTETLQINLLPLKIDEENVINTAILHSNDLDKLYLSLYNGTLNADNLAQSNLPLLLLHSYNNYYKDWLRFIILAKILKWSNVLPIEQALDIDVYKQAFAYELKLTLKEVLIRTLNKDYCFVEFEAYSSF